MAAPGSPSGQAYLPRLSLSPKLFPHQEGQEPRPIQTRYPKDFPRGASQKSAQQVEVGQPVWEIPHSEGKRGVQWLRWAPLSWHTATAPPSCSKEKLLRNWSRERLRSRERPTQYWPAWVFCQHIVDLRDYSSFWQLTTLGQGDLYKGQSPVLTSSRCLPLPPIWAQKATLFSGAAVPRPWLEREQLSNKKEGTSRNWRGSNRILSGC